MKKGGLSRGFPSGVQEVVARKNSLAPSESRRSATAGAVGGISYRLRIRSKGEEKGTFYFFQEGPRGQSEECNPREEQKESRAAPGDVLLFRLSPPIHLKK